MSESHNDSIKESEVSPQAFNFAALGRMGFVFGPLFGMLAGTLGALGAVLITKIALALGADSISLGVVISQVILSILFFIITMYVALRDKIGISMAAGLLFGSVIGVLLGFTWGITLGVIAGILGAALSFTQVPALARREFASLFYSPIAYVVGAVFLGIYGFLAYFFLGSPGAPATLSTVQGFAVVSLLPVIVPILTMRLLADEKRSGTLEVLMTAPVSDWEVVAAKYFAAFSVFLTMVLPTLLHVLSLYMLSEEGPLRSGLIGGHVGFIFVAAFYMAFGVLASSMARDQVIAAIIGFAFTFTIAIIGALGPQLAMSAGKEGNTALAEFLSFIGPIRHFQEFAMGNISSQSIIYLVSTIIFLLFLATRMVESRKWS